MNKLFTAALTLALILTVSACSQSENGGEEAAAAEPVSNELLAYTPADTPYLYANLQPIPDDVIDFFFEHLQPALNEVQGELSQALTDMDSGQPETEQGDIMMRLHLALMQELDGKLSRPGLESLGLDPSAHHLLYGMGAFPVLRLGLSDPEALRTTVQRILDKAGIPAPTLDYQGVSYWRLSDDDSDEVPLALYISILSDHLAIGLLPTTEESGQLPLFLGIDLPAGSDARERLVKLNLDGGYTPYGSGILDFHRLADQFLQADSSLARILAENESYDPNSLTQECVSEIHGIIDHAPVLKMGMTEMSTQAIAVRYDLDTPQTLAGQLMELVSEIPAARAVTDRILEFSFGMQVGPVRDFLREKVTAIVEDPYQCEHLADLNLKAQEALEQLNQPMPPLLNNFIGIRASVDDISMGEGSIPQDARGHLALHVEKPEMFVGMAQMFLPDLSEMTLVPGDPPKRLPESLIPVPGLVAFAALSDDAIGLSLGAGEEAALPAFLDEEPGAEGTFLSVGYDMAAYLEFTENMGHDMSGYEDEDSGEDVHIDHPMMKISQALNDSYKEMTDRSYTSLRFTPRGFVAESRVTFR